MIRVISFDIWKTLLRGGTRGYGVARGQAILKAIGWTGDTQTGLALIDRAKTDLDARTDDTGVQYGFGPRVDEACRLMGLPQLDVMRMEQLSTEARALHLQMPPSLMEPDLPETFDDLRASGFEIAVISNTGFTDGAILGAILRELGLNPDHEVYSDVLGYAKPDRRIFNYLVAASSCRPDEILHIGDNPKADVAGATEAGLHALLYQPDGEAGPGIITRHADLQRHPLLTGLTVT